MVCHCLHGVEEQEDIVVTRAKAAHGNARKRICQYLKSTKNKGTILFPSKELTVDCFVDSNFAGQWNTEDPEDPLRMKS